jgi:hypothetical protein
LVNARTGTSTTSKPAGYVAAPFQRVHPNEVAARLAGERNAQEIPLQAAEWKVFVQAEGNLHQSL